MFTRKLYRVFPWVKGGAEDEPGGALHVPPQGAGRFDNPSEYEILYGSDSPEGAVAEAFGRHPLWMATMLTGIPTLPGSRHALASIEVNEEVELCDLDDPRVLLELGLRPSAVLSREYRVTQAMALGVFAGARHGGLSWWSYYNPTWKNVGIWRSGNERRWGMLRLAEVRPLSIGDVVVHAAAHAIVRMIAVEK